MTVSVCEKGEGDESYVGGVRVVSGLGGEWYVDVSGEWYVEG